jgi:hypothetical protein
LSIKNIFQYCAQLVLVLVLPLVLLLLVVALVLALAVVVVVWWWWWWCCCCCGRPFPRGLLRAVPSRLPGYKLQTAL